MLYSSSTTAIALLLLSTILPCAHGWSLSSTLPFRRTVPLQQSSSSSSSLHEQHDHHSNSNNKKTHFLSKLKFKRLSADQKEISSLEKKKKKKSIVKYNITSVQDLESYYADEAHRFRNSKGEIDYDLLLRSLHVQGDTQMIGSPHHANHMHPVLQLLHERKRNNNNNTTTTSSSTSRTDNCKIALAIEGGGMRGCVSAGMIAAVHYLNLTNAFDVVYGSSAGTIIGAYLITGQLPWFGPELYYDKLTTAGRHFIDTRRLLRSIGFGLLDPRLHKDVLTRRANGGKPVLNLQYLLKTTVQETKPLDWTTFVEKQEQLPLKVIASGLKRESSIVLDMEKGAFASLSDLTDCMHASCLLPGIAGPLMNIDVRALQGASVPQKLVLGNNRKESYYEPLADALLFEPLPYHSAIKEGATHVVVVRSRPDGVDVTGKGGIFERLIFRRFFLRKNRLPNIYRYLKMHMHKKIYARDVLELNKEARSTRDYKDTSAPHLMAMAVPPGSPEVTRLEVGRQAIFEGMRRGFARAYDCLVEDPAERGRGAEVAKQFFPDEILDYDPRDITNTDDSAFAVYMRQNNIQPRSWSENENEVVVL